MKRGKYTALSPPSTSHGLKIISPYINPGAISPVGNVTPGISAKSKMASGIHLRTFWKKPLRMRKP
jgi:hypothetical protein